MSESTYSPPNASGKINQVRHESFRAFKWKTLIQGRKITLLPQEQPLQRILAASIHAQYISLHSNQPDNVLCEVQPKTSLYRNMTHSQHKAPVTSSSVRIIFKTDPPRDSTWSSGFSLYISPLLLLHHPVSPVSRVLVTHHDHI